jgi:S-adenosylhomocysteine hydrolase
MATLAPSKGSKKFLRRLPLLDFAATLYPEISLKNTYLICAQHLVSTTYALFHTLLRLGLKPRHLSAIGKCYSTDPQAYKEMDGLGIDVCPSSLSFNSRRSFDEQYRENIQGFVQERLDRCRRFEKIIVLDDGAELILALQPYLKQSQAVIGIEQTSSGFHRLKHKKIPFPIVNVARSPAKLNYEAPIIAKLVVDTLLRRIKNLTVKPREVLILGNGPIGSKIHEILSQDFHVEIFDTVASKSTIASQDFEASLKRFDLIIGCTGKHVLTSEHYRLLKENVILVSASSSDREFQAVALRSKLPKVIDCHQNLFVNGICLINCGFPINFDAEYREIDCDELQLTRSLLLAAILQASHMTDFSTKGFVPLDIENQRDIVQQFQVLFAPEKVGV